MNDPTEVLGYALFRPARDDARPGKGPDCPLTLELLDLALGHPIDPTRIEELRTHLKNCPECAARFSAQQRAVARAALPEPERPGAEGYNGPREAPGDLAGQ